jgi:choline monooxygenase
LSTSNYVLERVDEEEHDLNWKAFMEIYLEDYHISVVHPGFRAFVDPDDVRAALHTVVGERFFCEQVNVRWPLPPAGSPLFGEYQSVLMDVLAASRRPVEPDAGCPRPPFAAIWLSLFPGQLIEWYPFCMVVTTYEPLSPTRTRLRSEYYFDREIAETRRDYVDVGLRVLDEVTDEDQLASEALQNGRQAAFARGDNFQGPYQMPMEQGLRRFHDCLRTIIDNK